MRHRACGVVIKRDEILMFRDVHSGRDCSTLPGGGIDDGEPIFDAAVFEVIEETGLYVDPSKLLLRYESRKPLVNVYLRQHSVWPHLNTCAQPCSDLRGPTKYPINQSFPSPSLSECVLMTTPVNDSAPLLEEDPEESALFRGERILQEAAWQKIEEHSDSPMTQQVLEALEVKPAEAKPAKAKQ